MQAPGTAVTTDNHTLTKAAVSMSSDTQLDTLRGTILAVDDSPTIRKLVSMTMEGQGYRVVVAADGIEALAILKEEHPDLILCDVAMPKLDGYQLCKIIKNSTDTKHIPVVMLTGKDGLFDKVRGKMAGCSNYIAKPFEPDLLISEVRKYVKPALIPMTPHKARRKAPGAEPPQDVPAGSAADTAAAGDSARLLNDRLSGLAMPAAPPVAPEGGMHDFSTRPAAQAAAPISIRADDLPPLPGGDTPPAAQAQREEEKPEALTPIAARGTIEFDKLLADLDQDNEIAEPRRPRDPFRSRCPGCRVIFKNVRPDDYDKHARCKKCGTRFHLGDNFVV